MSDTGEHRVLAPNTLVLYVDDTGDEKIGDPEYPVFAFGGVACVSDYMNTICCDWRSMKASVFPQLRTALHAREHLKESRLKGIRRDSVLSAMSHPGLARFGLVLTDHTVVTSTTKLASAITSLTMRFEAAAIGLASRGYWKRGGDVLVVFEASKRLESAIEGHLGQMTYTFEGKSYPIAGAFMPKIVADPMLEMADFVAYTIGRNVKYQMLHGHENCTPNFEALFRKADRLLASYMEAQSITFTPAAAA